MRFDKILILVGLLQLSSVTAGQELATQDPNKVKAAFLRNFAHYVTWPEKAFADASSPWRVCVLGRDPFGEVLDKTLAGRTERGRPFEVSRAETLGELPACQIIYVTYADPGERRATLAALKNRPVLTVGDTADFLSEGGMIRFQVKERVEISINLDRARSASLLIQTKMLEVSYQVLEDGILHTLR
ncbi:MAG: hypothetical protein H6R26_2380 [Proteobacteria bacterium]|nr:hypothetical protein [Pseudomonadota bacterium]